MRFRVRRSSRLCVVDEVVRNITLERKTHVTVIVKPILQYLYRLYCVFFFILFVRKLQHPHIVKFYGTSLLKSADTTRVILVMEKCKGNLKSQIFDHPEATPSKTKNLAVFREVCRWAKEITDALAFIHKRGVIHRDLKLENILV